jgi:hypothetical protein
MQSSLEALRRIGLERRLLPENTTDMIQPVDQNVGVDVKRRVGEKLNKRLAEDEEFANRWLGVEGSFSASERRILMTELLDEAWAEFCAAKDFKALGLSTGCVMVRTGVDRAAVGLGDHPIGIKDVKDYSFEHVPLGDPLPELDLIHTLLYGSLHRCSVWLSSWVVTYIHVVYGGRLLGGRLHTQPSM